MLAASTLGSRKNETMCVVILLPRAGICIAADNLAPEFQQVHYFCTILRATVILCTAVPLHCDDAIVVSFKTKLLLRVARIFVTIAFLCFRKLELTMISSFQLECCITVV